MAVKITTQVRGSEDWNGQGPCYWGTAWDADGNMIGYGFGKTRAQARTNARQKAKEILALREKQEEDGRVYDEELYVCEEMALAVWWEKEKQAVGG